MNLQPHMPSTGPENVVFVFIKFAKCSQDGCRRVYPITNLKVSVLITNKETMIGSKPDVNFHVVFIGNCNNGCAIRSQFYWCPNNFFKCYSCEKEKNNYVKVSIISLPAKYTNNCNSIRLQVHTNGQRTNSLNQSYQYCNVSPSLNKRKIINKYTAI